METPASDFTIERWSKSNSGQRIRLELTIDEQHHDVFRVVFNATLSPEDRGFIMTRLGEVAKAYIDYKKKEEQPNG